MYCLGLRLLHGQLADQLLLLFFLFSLCTARVMISEESKTLNALCGCVGEVTSKQKHVPGLDFPGEPHEDTRIEDKR